MVTRSNKYFLERGRKRAIAYDLKLATSRNPDFVVKYPNEVNKTNVNRKIETTKRVNKQCDLREALLKVRLEKKTGERRL